MSRVHVVYFSRRGNNFTPEGIRYLEQGNTERAAHMICEALNCPSFEIVPLKPYAEDYRACCKEAMDEVKADARPAIVSFCDEVASCDTVILGYPNWCGTMPMCVRTFLDHYDWTGKCIAPLCTNEGSGLANSIRDLQLHYPAARILEGLSVRGCKVDEERETILAWAAEISK